MKATFETWQQPNLANLSADQQAEIVRLNNQQVKMLAVLKGLAESFEIECDHFCKKAVRNPAYVAAMELLK